MSLSVAYFQASAATGEWRDRLCCSELNSHSPTSLDDVVDLSISLTLLCTLSSKTIMKGSSPCYSFSLCRRPASSPHTVKSDK